MKENKFKTGSEWRLWDLHVHTPFSHLSNGFKNDWDNYVKELFKRAIENNVSAFGITDYFTIIKLYRQVIIVTHNANIVVNADAEQVIVAENNEERLSYRSGSLENPDINTAVCNILEGGKIAFQQRRNKYHLN